jgi:hypothetical protein
MPRVGAPAAGPLPSSPFPPFLPLQACPDRLTARLEPLLAALALSREELAWHFR